MASDVTDVELNHSSMINSSMQNHVTPSVFKSRKETSKSFTCHRTYAQILNSPVRGGSVSGNINNDNMLKVVDGTQRIQRIRSMKERGTARWTDDVFSASPTLFSKSKTPPIIDTRPIEFWMNSKEAVNSSPSGYSTYDVSVNHFNFDLYQDSNKTKEETNEAENYAKIFVHCMYNFQTNRLEVAILNAENLPLKNECASCTHYHSELESSQQPFNSQHLSKKDSTCLSSMWCLSSPKSNKHDVPAAASCMSPTQCASPASNTNLLSQDEQRLCNPYVRLQLLPDKDVCHMTKVKKKTQNPEWNERFTFDITYVQCTKRSIELHVRDYRVDSICKHRTLGKVLLPLADLDLVIGSTQSWPVIYFDEELDVGEILISMQFLPSAGRLSVDIVKARNVLPQNLERTADPFVKVVCLDGQKILKTKRTNVINATSTPKFNESLRFDISEEQIKRCTIMISVYDHRSSYKNELIGRVSVGQSPSGSEERDFWTDFRAAGFAKHSQWLSLRQKQTSQSSVSSTEQS